MNSKISFQEEVLNLLSRIIKEQHNDSRIALPLYKETRFVRPDDIIRCEAANNYTWFYLVDGEKIIISKGLYEYSGILEGKGFIRCHQSHLVNKKYVLSLHRDDHIHELKAIDGSLVPVSRSKVDAIHKAFSDLHNFG